MIKWYFLERKDAEFYERLAFARVPSDTLWTGAYSPRQVTKRWSDIEEVDGGFAIVAPLTEAKPVNSDLLLGTAHGKE